jgi:hypothetical protein
MEIIKTLIFSSDSHEGQRIKSSLEVLPDNLNLDYNFECQLFNTNDELFSYLKENTGCLLVVNHDFEKSSILRVTELFEEGKKKSYKKVNHPRSIIVLGPNDARLALGCTANEYVTGYIIHEDIEWKNFGKQIILMIAEADKLPAEDDSIKAEEIKKLYEIISFQEKLFDDLSENYIKLAEQKQKTYPAASSSYKENERYSLWLMDVRITSNKEFKDIFLRYEAERILELLIQYIYGYVDKYPYVKLYSDENRIVIGFKEEDAIKCALEIIIKLSQIHILGESVINNFSVKIGVDKSKITFHESSDKMIKDTGIEHLSLLLDKAAKNNTLYISEKIFTRLSYKQKEYFFLFQKGGEHKIYSFRQKFGYGI